MEMLKIEVDEAGSKAIEDELEDIEETMKKIENSEPVNKVKVSLKELAETDEAEALGKLDEEFQKSPEGQALEKEIDEFFGALDEHITETDNGIHIDNEAFEIIEDEADDIDAQFKKLEKTHWAKDYESAIENVWRTEEGNNLEESVDDFERSEEGKMLEKEFEDLDEALKEHVKVSDVPEDWKDDMFLF